jgi:CBS domain containing-hemolysin-like protein
MVAATVIIILVSLLFSAFFSGMEIAYLSSNKLKIEIGQKGYPRRNGIVDTFLHHPGRYITTLLVGNNIALVVYSLQMTLLLRLLWADIGWRGAIGAETIISTIIIIFTAEFIPKAVFKANPNAYFRGLAWPVWFFYVVFYPVVGFVTALARGILRLFGVRLPRRAGVARFDKVDLAHLVGEASENATRHDNENEIKIFQNAMEFHELEVRDCMVPRVDMDAVEADSPFEELKKRFLETRYSRIPIYVGTIDNVVGYVNSKSLLRHPTTIREAMRPVLYVTESMEVQRLLSRFIREHSSLAIVIDEFGGTAGMVTLEDMMEEIFGEIEDEHDAPERVEKRVGPGEYVFSGRLEVETLNEKYGLGIPESDEYETLAGYIILDHNGLPKQGEVLESGGMTVKILRINGSRIELVRLKQRETVGNS